MRKIIWAVIFLYSAKWKEDKEICTYSNVVICIFYQIKWTYGGWDRDTYRVWKQRSVHKNVLLGKAKWRDESGDLGFGQTATQYWVIHEREVCEMWTSLKWFSYAEEAGCSANVKELPSSANGVEHSHLMSNKHHLKKEFVTLNNL